MKKYFIRTFGCKTNQYESQLMKELLVLEGNEVVENYCDAECVVINSCAVTQAAERDVYKFIRRVYNESKRTKKILLVGCYAEYINKNSLTKEFFKRLSVEIPVEFIGNDEKYSFINHQISEISCHISRFFGHKRAYVKVQDGCNNFCSYCVVPYLRNKLISKPKDIIFKEIDSLCRCGYDEIYLVGTNIAKYNFDNTDLVELSQEILKNFPQVTLIFSSLNPSDFNEKFFNFLKEYKDKIFPHFHIPLQSPLNEILEDMGRNYTYEDFVSLVDRLRKTIPYVIISSDIIVGYPLETKEKFKVVFERLKNLNLNWYHIFPYSPRLRTPAYKKYGSFFWGDAKLRVRELNLINHMVGESYFKNLCKVK